jgi:ABC-type multidrug transport system ATPase subunit
MYEVELIGVSKGYGDKLALDNVSAAFEKGKITAVLAVVAAGKQRC